MPDKLRVGKMVGLRVLKRFAYLLKCRLGQCSRCNEPLTDNSKQVARMKRSRLGKNSFVLKGSRISR